MVFVYRYSKFKIGWSRTWFALYCVRPVFAPLTAALRRAAVERVGRCCPIRAVDRRAHNGGAVDRPGLRLARRRQMAFGQPQGGGHSHSQANYV